MLARVATLLLAAALAIASPAFAHSALQSSVPADGAVVTGAKTVRLTFAADVRLVGLRLVANNLDLPLPIDRAAPAAMSFEAALPQLGEGTYEIKWSAMAADGHVVTGSFSFTISARGGTAGHTSASAKLNVWSIAATLVKAALYFTCLTAAGGAFFLIFFSPLLNTPERKDIAGFTRAMATVALYLTIARVMIAAASIGGNAASLWDWSLIQLVLDGSEGGAAAVRALGLVVIAAFAERATLTAAIGGLGVAGSFALTGHGMALRPDNLPQLAVLIHLVAVAFWIGALVPLLRLCASRDVSRLTAILKHFGNIALVAVGVLIAAGTFVLWALLDLPEGLIGSTYGLLMLLKLTAVAGLLTLAALNKLRLTPRIEAGDLNAAVQLRRSILAEIALAVLILLVTAMFTTLTGPPGLH